MVNSSGTSSPSLEVQNVSSVSCTGLCRAMIECLAADYSWMGSLCRLFTVDAPMNGIDAMVYYRIANCSCKCTTQS